MVWAVVTAYQGFGVVTIFIGRFLNFSFILGWFLSGGSATVTINFYD